MCIVNEQNLITTSKYFLNLLCSDEGLQEVKVVYLSIYMIINFFSQQRHTQICVNLLTTLYTFFRAPINMQIQF